MQARSLIKNAHVISPGIDTPGATIEIIDGKIAGVHRNPPSEAPDGEIYDAKGNWVAPGFIDIHTHGAAGHDFCDGKSDTLRSIAKAKLKEGVTSFLPTTLTVTETALHSAVQAAEPYFHNQEYAKVPGIHVEGPFINPKCVGAQNPEHVRPPNLEEIKRLHSLLPVKIVSLAVEMPDGDKLVGELTDLGIVSSFAHTAATYEQFQRAKAAGASHLTHFCNQMTPLHHREIGLVGAGLLDDEIKVEMICDLIHLCPPMIQLAFKAIDHDRIMMITDSISASGLADDQRAKLGELDVIVKDGVARLESGALAGSTLRMNVALKNIYETTHLPLSTLIGTTAYNQAQSLGLTDRGRIEPGLAADLVVLDKRFQTKAVMVDGQIRHMA